MVYGSVCSGIEAATVAWGNLGWEPAFFSEIEPFARTVLKYHYPEISLHGDFITIMDGDYKSIDLLVAGTPCQSFSLAGLRGGLADERGNLALSYLRLVALLRPRWLVWENVPGVLSILSHDDSDEAPPPNGVGLVDEETCVVEDVYDADERHAFGCFLAGLQELGYGFAYRVLDAQYFGLAQQRKRVFVVGRLGDWRPAAAVLFEPASLRGGSSPRRRQKDSRSHASENSAKGECAAMSFSYDNRWGVTTLDDVSLTLDRRGGGGGTVNGIVDYRQDDRTVSLVRRLTPRECERLQGFPDDYTLVPYRGRPASDSKRYSALGNSMAVPVMAWIGRRIDTVDRATTNIVFSAPSTTSTAFQRRKGPAKRLKALPVADLLSAEASILPAESDIVHATTEER